MSCRGLVASLLAQACQLLAADAEEVRTVLGILDLLGLLLRVRVRVRGRVGLGLGLGLGLVLGLGFTLAFAVLFRIASKEGESTPFSEASVSARVSATIWANLEPMEMFMALAYLVKG